MADDFMGGGAKSVPFETVGDSVTGTLLDLPEKRVQTDIENGTPKTFPDGSPKTMFAVRLQTTLRDPGDPFDMGERTIFLKWKSLQAVQAAIRASGAPGPEVGGQLTLTLAGFEAAPKRGWNPIKLWNAQYVPPPPGAQFMNGTDTAGYAPQGAYAPPQPGQYQMGAYPAHPGQAPVSAAPVSPAGQQSMLARLAQQQSAGISRITGNTQEKDPPF